MELTFNMRHIMKKYLAILIICLGLTSCYEDYIYDFTYTAIYFPYTHDVRTFVVGEGMKFEVGAALGGVRKNTRDRVVTFTLDNSMVNPSLLSDMMVSDRRYVKDAVSPVAVLEPMPVNYFTISNSSQMVIKSGQHSGTVVIKADSTNFLNDSVKTKYSTYILPFRIQTADADSILYKKRSNMVGTKFENMLYGNYWHGGVAVVNRPSKTDTTIIYKTTIPASSEAKVWTLKTVGPCTLTTSSYYNADASANAQMNIVIKGTKVYLSSAAGSTYTFTSDGTSIYNNNKLLQARKLFLKYKYTDPVSGYTYHCTDTIAFRNRLRDGINEWQDENPSHYTK